MAPRYGLLPPGKSFLFAVSAPSYILPLMLLLGGVGFCQGQALTNPASAPDPLQQHYQSARTYGLAGDQVHAQAEFKAFLGEAFRRMGDALAGAGEFKEAGDALDDALTFAPDDPSVL